jgi:hypothetical protein
MSGYDLYSPCNYSRYFIVKNSEGTGNGELLTVKPTLKRVRLKQGRLVFLCLLLRGSYARTFSAFVQRLVKPSALRAYKKGEASRREERGYASQNKFYFFTEL